MPNPFFDSLWPGMVAWSILYISDYSLTIICAHLRRVRANQIIVIEGSYELTPYYQRDIDSLKLFSPRFLVALVWSLFLLALAWALAISQPLPQLYDFVLGSMILLELAIHVRHFRNLFLYWSVNHTDEVRAASSTLAPSRIACLRMTCLLLQDYSSSSSPSRKTGSF